MTKLNRRSFMKGSVGVAATFGVLAPARSSGPNERIVVGVMGLGGRGTYLAKMFARRQDVEVTYLCDVDTRRFARAREAVEEVQSGKPKLVQDFRRILEDKDVDVLVSATPDHWHALGSILACQANKDVYVEKPMAHTVWEGRKMVEAARKYQRVVQVGMQSRSAPYVRKAREYIEAGNLGDVYLVRVCNMMKHPRQKQSLEQPVPQGFDYDMWCGPAPKLPYNPSRRWLNQWEYSCGPIAGDAIHQLDLARYLTNDVPYPKTVAHVGALNVLQDGRNTPDTQLALFEYDGLTLSFEATLWTPYIKKISGDIRKSDRFPDWPFCSTKVEIFGTEGFLYFGRHGGGWQAYDADAELVRSEYGRPADAEHLDNFIDCIQTRERPVADVEVGHLSTLLSHLANISYRVGNQKLEFDPDTESLRNCSEANELLSRAYRQPWVIPDEV